VSFPRAEQSPTTWPPVVSGAGEEGEPEDFVVPVLLRYADRALEDDPNDIVSALSVLGLGTDDERIELTLQGAGTIRLPDATGLPGWYCEWDIVDIYGNPATIGAEDLNNCALYFHDADIMPTGTYAYLYAVAGSGGTLGDSGVYAGIEHNGSGQRAVVAINAGAGAGWGARTLATEDPLGRGVRPHLQSGNTTSNIRVGAVLLTADGGRSYVSAAGPAPVSGNGMTDGRFSRIGIAAGWQTAGGVDGSKLTLNLKAMLADLRTIPNWRRTVSFPAPVAPSLPIHRWAILGDSNGNGTTVGPFSGTAVPAGWTFRDQGVNLANYPAGTSPACGMVPYLINAGAGSGDRYVIRRSENAKDFQTAAFDTQINGLVADVNTLAMGDPEVIVIVMAANDSQSLAETIKFKSELKRVLQLLRDYFPDAIIVLPNERTTDGGVGGVYEFLTTNNAAKLTVISELGLQRVGVAVDETADLADAIHWSCADDGGQEDMAVAVLARVAQLAA
jgi:hypothetical protein